VFLFVSLGPVLSVRLAGACTAGACTVSQTSWGLYCQSD